MSEKELQSLESNQKSEPKIKRPDTASIFLQYGLSLLRPFVPDESVVLENFGTEEQLPTESEIEEVLHYFGGEFNHPEILLQINYDKLNEYYRRYYKGVFQQNQKLFIDAIMSVVNNTDKKIELTKNVVMKIKGRNSQGRRPDIIRAFTTKHRFSQISSYIEQNKTN